jgi:hypothetical protein
MDALGAIDSLGRPHAHGDVVGGGQVLGTRNTHSRFLRLTECEGKVAFGVQRSQPPSQGLSQVPAGYGWGQRDGIVRVRFLGMGAWYSHNPTKSLMTSYRGPHRSGCQEQ